jgi:YVTN family beta-propeller protein
MAPAACTLQLQYSQVIGAHVKTVAANELGIYAGLYDSDQIVRMDPRTGTPVWRVQSSQGRINGIATWQDLIVVTNRDRGRVTLHDAATGADLAVLDVGRQPWGVVATDGRAYVANYADNSVSVIDLTSREVIREAAVGQGPVALVAGGEFIYVTHVNGQVAKLDREGRIVTQTQADALGSRGIAWDPARRRVYVGSAEGHLLALDADSLRPVARVTLPGPAYAVTLNPNTGRVFAVDAESNRLYVVEQDGQVSGEISLPAQDRRDGGQGLAVWDGLIVVANYAAGSVTVLSERACSISAGVSDSTALSTSPRASAGPSQSAGPGPTPEAVRAKIEILWPHDTAPVQVATLANMTVYLMSPDSLDSVPCAWEPTVRLWRALNSEPAEPIAVGEKRMLSTAGRTFPVWDFNDVDISPAQSADNRLAFFATVDGVETRHNIWAHSIDARTIQANQNTPNDVLLTAPAEVDARIEIVWPHGGLQADRAQLANITAHLYAHGSLQAISPQAGWYPIVRLHRSVNTETDAGLESSVVGRPRTILTERGVTFLAWDFNDVDIASAQDPMNTIYFWVSVDAVQTYPNIWTHGSNARTVFPQTDVPNSCQ